MTVATTVLGLLPFLWEGAVSRERVTKLANHLGVSID
jgi:hypothetical protein